MNIRILITFLLFTCQFIFSQEKFKLDNDSFILGMLDDYNGREIPLDHPFKSTRVTSFYCSEINLEKIFLDSIQKNYDINDLTVEDNTIYSKSLAERFNKYYNSKKIDGGWTFDGVNYQAYMLTLRKNIFQTNQQNISFILGAYFRNGKKEKGQLKMVLYNSLSHFDAIKKAMKKVGFKYKVEIYSGIPATQIIYFKPSENYQNLFMNSELFKPNEKDCD